jgi:hypothetical protein
MRIIARQLCRRGASNIEMYSEDGREANEIIGRKV